MTASPTIQGALLQKVVAELSNYENFDLANNPSTVWEVTRWDNQPDSETVTLANGDVYKRTFTYSSVNGTDVLTARSAWVKQ